LKSVYSRLKPQLKKDRKTKEKSEKQELPDNFVYCKLPFNYTLINSGGNVLPCPHCHGVSEFGTITPDHSFEDVWFNEKFRQLRRNILTQNPPEMCRVCSILSMYNLDENSLSISRGV
jgi:radical SAM protein with 4Fe4S-binding SPASM domain